MKKKEVGLSRDEKFIIKVLALAWDAYFKLPELHPCHRDEMCRAIHAAQYLVMIRPTIRTSPEIFPVTKKEP